jgi:hypothetical protein
MNTLLKIRRKALEFETKQTRQLERHYRDTGRRLRGWYSKKHGKNQPKPEDPGLSTFKKAKAEQRPKFIEEAYAKLWNLTDHRKRFLQYEARHLHLVRGFLKGQPYADIEVTGTYYQPDRDYLMELAQEYSSDTDNVLKDKFIVWWDAAFDHILKNEAIRNKKKMDAERTPRVASA